MVGVSVVDSFEFCSIYFLVARVPWQQDENQYLCHLKADKVQIMLKNLYKIDFILPFSAKKAKYP